MAVVKNETSPGLAVSLPDGGTIILSEKVAARPPFCHQGYSGGGFCPPVRPADRDLARDRKRRVDLSRQYVERRAGRARSARKYHKPRAGLFSGGRGRDLYGLSPPGRARRHPEFYPDRADLDVRQPRGDADLDDGRVSALQPRKIPECRRRGGHSAQQGLRLPGRLDARCDDAHPFELRRSPECRRCGADRSGLRKDQSRLRRKISDQARKPDQKAARQDRHPGSRRHAGGDRAGPQIRSGNAARGKRSRNARNFLPASWSWA